MLKTICVNSKSGRGGKDGLQSSVQDRRYSVEGTLPAVTASYRPNIAIEVKREMENGIDKPVQVGHISKSNSQANRVYSVKGKTVTMVANGGGGAKTGLYKIDLPDGDYLIRKLNPIEAERAQTLPDNYTEGISDTQRYKCVGNGWTVDVIAHILNNLKNVE